ncbi:MAG: sugar ABC transporter permease [Clostridia bacterium]|nr:sugar ABC transporter permease [Clostridia bacterium]
MENERVALNGDGAVGVMPPAPKRKKRINREEVAGTLMASIPLIGFLLFGFLPLVLAFAMAFMELRFFSFVDATWVGLANFKEVVEDPMFWESVVNTLVLGSSTLISLVLSLLIAYLLSKNIVGKKTFRMIYFLPYVCSVVAITLMWKYMFNTNYGIINQILGRTGENPIDWLGDSKYFSWAVIIMSVWSGMGYGIILFTAALTGVNQSMVEASKIDGAGAFRTFWSIVFPAISPTSFYLLVMGVIGALQSFAVTNVLAQSGGPNSDGVTIVFYLYRRVFEYIGKMGVASASAWILALMILVITIIQFILSRRWVSYDQ